MNELKTLQEEVKQICFNLDASEKESASVEKQLLNILNKSYTLGIMKGVELVEGELPKYPPNSDREELVLEQIKGIINKLKQELK